MPLAVEGQHVPATSPAGMTLKGPRADVDVDASRVCIIMEGAKAHPRTPSRGPQPAEAALQVAGVVVTGVVQSLYFINREGGAARVAIMAKGTIILACWAVHAIHGQ